MKTHTDFDTKHVRSIHLNIRLGTLQIEATHREEIFSYVSLVGSEL
jgi:hypothetical protein